MKNNIRLTEKELVGLISKILKEQDNQDNPYKDLKSTKKGFFDMVERRPYQNCIVQRHHGNKMRVNCINDGILFDTTSAIEAKTL